MATVCTIEDLKRDPGAIVNQARTSLDPVFVNQNGTATAVIVNVDAYLSLVQACDEIKRIFRDYGVSGSLPLGGTGPYQPAHSTAQVPKDIHETPTFEVDPRTLPDA